jgi:hypothetical protein
MAYDVLTTIDPTEVTGTGVLENDNFEGFGTAPHARIDVSNASEGATIQITVEQTIDGVNYIPVKTIDINEPFVPEPYFSTDTPEKALSFTGNVVNYEFKFKTDSFAKKFRFSYNVIGTATIAITM